MKINFQYDKEKDIWCILYYGKGSYNSPDSTKTYKRLIKEYGENPTHQNISDFIEKYITKNQIDLHKIATEYQKNWDYIADEYRKRAEKIFGISLPQDITAYITINNRYPYDIKNNLFFASVNNLSLRGITMHELWHFYTWYKFGIAQVGKMEKQKYNDIKEALTVLLNVTCKDLFPENAQDDGYPQHQELRKRILQSWEKENDIEKLWVELIA